MATPFMAGCCALLNSQYPDLTVNETFALVQESGSQVPWWYDQSVLSSTAHQGSGLVNIEDAISRQSLVTPPSVSLGTSAATVSFNLTIWNRANRAKTYNLSHEPAGLMQIDRAESDGVVGPDLSFNQMYPIYATAHFPTPSVTIPGGGKVDVTVLITPPHVPLTEIGAVKIDWRPLYSGFVTVHNNDENFAIPYIGQPWDIGPVKNSIATIAPIQIWPSEEIINELAPSARPFANYAGTRYFSARPDVTNQPFSMGKYGILGVLWGTTKPDDFIRFDLVPANSSFVPHHYGFNPSVISVPPEDLVYPTGANVTMQTIVGLDDVVEVLAAYEGPFGDTFLSEGFWWDNLNSLPNADYRIVMRVLEQGGDYDDEKAWDGWLSAIVSIDTEAEFVETPFGTGIGSL